MKLPGWIATPSIGITDPVLDSPAVVSGVEGNTQLTSFVLRVLLAVERFQRAADLHARLPRARRLDPRPDEHDPKGRLATAADDRSWWIVVLPFGRFRYLTQ